MNTKGKKIMYNNQNKRGQKECKSQGNIIS